MTPDAGDLEALALEECAREPIRVPGSIQPHGVLLAVHEPALTVAIASANCSTLLGVDADRLLGTALEEAVGPEAAGALATAATLDPDDVNPVAVTLATPTGPQPFEAVLHRAGGLLVIDLEPDDDADGRQALASFPSLRAPVRRLRAAGSTKALADAVAREVHALTGFDRVMVYRFDAEWNGEVVAERRRPDMEPYLGLHYPASDIPPQARELYRTSWIRLIADVDAVPAPLVPAANPLDGEPLDLGASTLRSVSPFHLEYLRNMGVGASMSISLLDRGELWGLIACHHDVAHRPSYGVRAAAELLGQIASLLVTASEDAGGHEGAIDTSAALADLLRHVSVSPETIGGALVDDPTALLTLAAATGAAVRVDQEIRCVGDAPPPDRAAAIARVLWDGTTGVRAVVATDALTLDHPALVDVTDLASGVVGVRIDDRPDRWILWFRPEVVRTVEWGGDPAAGKVRVEGDGTPKLHPRDSFGRWSDIVRRRAAPWSPHHVAAAETLGRHVTDVVRRRANEEAATAAAFQRTLLLEHLPTVPGISLRTRYLPAEQDALGGDWYDLFLLSDERVGITLGDVAGHGMEVAGIMAQLRHGLRAYLLRAPSPAGAMAGLNELTHRLLPRELATVVVADLEPATGRLRVANAGHPPPLVVPSDGGAPTYLEGAHGPALGILSGSTYAEREVVLSTGDLLVLYTDGLVERRGESLDAGLARLAERARDPGPDLDAFADRLVAEGSSDDVTLLVVRFDGAARRPS